MTRYRYFFVVIALLSCATSLLLDYVPRFSKWSIFVDFGCILTVVSFVLSGLIGKYWNALAMFFMLLVVLMIGDSAVFAYRTNNICGSRDHVLKSDVDAIEAGKELVSKHISYGLYSGVDVRAAMNRTDNCCGVIRSRNWGGVIVWHVFMFADVETGRISVEMQLSNCGEIFNDTQFSTIEPRSP